MGRSCYKITDPKLPHFITSTVLHWIPVFTRPATVNILLDSLHYLMADGLKVYAYVILENHLHMVVQSNQLNRDIARFKSFTAKKLIGYLDENNVKRSGFQPFGSEWRNPMAPRCIGNPRRMPDEDSPASRFIIVVLEVF